MQVIYTQRCRHYPPAQIAAGNATWDDAERSVKFIYPDKNGNPARTSPELGGPTLLELLEVALSQGVVTPKEVASVLHAAL